MHVAFTAKPCCRVECEPKTSNFFADAGQAEEDEAQRRAALQAAVVVVATGGSKACSSAPLATNHGFIQFCR